MTSSKKVTWDFFKTAENFWFLIFCKGMNRKVKNNFTCKA